MVHFARIAVVIAIALTGNTLLAQLPTARLDLVTPAAGKIGSELEITISGAELEESNQLTFNHPGITATQALSEADEIDTTARPIPHKFMVNISDDVPPGIYEVRASGPMGTTNVRSFAVGNLETIVKSGNHRTRETAMELPLGTAVTGNVDAGNSDYYRFTAKKSQRLIIDCFGSRIGSRIDATLALYDSTGRRINHVRDVTQLDPLIEFIAPASGDYFVSVYDFEYNGGAEYFYQIALHDGPHVSFIYPPVAEPGDRKLTIYGHNLPGAKQAEGMMVANNVVEQVSVNVAIDKQGDHQEFDASLMETPTTSPFARELFRLATPDGNANPVAIGLATAPLKLEQEPNNQTAEANKVDVPCEFVGQFYPRGDQDVISFDAKKGDVYWIELLSHRLGIPSDPHLTIEKVVTDEGGQRRVSLVAEVDDQKQTADQNSTHAHFNTILSDPSYMLTADADASYQVTVKDLYGNTNNDPRFAYRLLVRPQRHDFDLLAYPDPISKNKNQIAALSTTLPRGGNTTIAVRVNRHHGFEGDVEITAEGLPDGIVCHSATASGKVNQISLVLSASENAAAWTGPIDIIGKARIDDREAIRQARCGAIIWGTQNAGQQPPVVRLVSDLVLSVTDRLKAPLSVQLGDGNLLETSRGGKLNVPIKAIRGEDIPDDLKVKMTGVPGINFKEAVVKGNEGTYPLEMIDQRIQPGIHTLYLTGTTKYKYKGNTELISKAEEDSKRLDGVVKQFAEQFKQAQENLRKAQEAVKTDQENQSLADAVKKADEESKRLDALSKQAQQRKQAADKKLNDTKNKNKPRDINLPYVSTPLRLRVVASPVTLNLSVPENLNQGDKMELAATIEKRFEFDERVDITVEVPREVSGITAKPVNIEKGKSEGKLELVLAPNATPGAHVLTVRTKLKFNNVNIDTTEEVTLTVNAAETTVNP